VATKLTGTLEREIKVHGVEAPVIVSLTTDGISFRIKGTRTALTNGWVQTVMAMNTPTNVKSYLMGNPLGVLESGARQRNTK
jgi:hypothetical protein